MGNETQPAELTAEVFNDLVKSIREQAPIVGVVVRRNLEGAIRAQFPEARIGLEMRPDNFYGLPVYFDDQEEECLEFKDRKLLRLYLNRREKPAEYCEYIAKLCNVPVEQVNGNERMSLSELMAVMTLLSKNRPGN